MTKPFRPMLGVQVDDLDSLRYPLMASPKIDGVRAIVLDGVVYSRSMKPIPNKHVQKLFGRHEFNLLDGELVVGSPTDKNCYNKTVSGVMSVEGEPDVQFYVFDLVGNILTARQRWDMAVDIVELYSTGGDILWVDQLTALGPSDVRLYEDNWLKLGYEGLMLKDPCQTYKQGRSTLKGQHLLKVKRFTDAEAEITGFEELMHNENEATESETGYTERSSHKANLKPSGTLGALLVKDIKTGVEFSVGSGFDASQRYSIWKYRDRHIGKLIKYKSFNHGVKDKPRHPVFLGFRSLLDTEVPQHDN